VLHGLENIVIVKSVATDNCKLFFVNEIMNLHAQQKLPWQNYIIAHRR